VLEPPAALALLAVLQEARSLGFLGPGPVEAQLQRALAFSEAEERPPELAVDLGTGGGLPGLVLALLWPSSQWLLIESSERRCRWLVACIGRLGITERCEVLGSRAEEAGRGHHRGTAPLVTARSFAPPGPTAECAAPFLRVGGHLVVSSPPEGTGSRWPTDGLARLGLGPPASLRVATCAGPVSLSTMACVLPCPETYPRRVGIPFKRPLF